MIKVNLNNPNHNTVTIWVRGISDLMQVPSKSSIDVNAPTIDLAQLLCAVARNNKLIPKILDSLESNNIVASSTEEQNVEEKAAVEEVEAAPEEISVENSEEPAAEEQEDKSEESDSSNESVDLSAMTTAQLREYASDRGIEGAKSMKRSELLKRLK